MPKSIMILCLSGILLGLSSGPAYGLRAIYICVRLNGEVILEGGDSDGGERDADEIWETLKEVKLRETDAFYKLEIAPHLKKYTIRLESQKGKALPIEFDAGHGGMFRTTVLTIKRVTPDSAGRTWSIDPEDLDGGADFRWITRYEARMLKDPKFAGETGQWLQQREEYKRAMIQRNYKSNFLFGILIGAGGLSAILFLYDFIRRIRRDGSRRVSASES